MRLAAAKELQNSADEDALPAIAAGLAKESDAEIKSLLILTQASVQLASTDRATRLAAIRALEQSDTGATRTMLLAIVAKKDGKFVEADDEIRVEAERSLSAVEGRLRKGDVAARIFSGISLGTILLLAALGLAITYGLMGVINMAHGELIMIGAYATYVVQNLFRQYAPGAFDWYLLFAIPVAFLVSGLVGVALERTVIRHLYGRPLETLLATWGLSLILIQAVRTIFGAQNVQVENPAWMSGGIEIMTNVVLPCSRIVIIGFAAFVLLLVYMLLTRTRLGLFVRAVTQNRQMASALGVRTPKVDMLAFGLGSGHRRSRRLRAFADRQRRAGSRPELHRRLVHGRRAGWRRAARRDGVCGARPRHRQQVPRGVARRGAREDRRARVHHRLHPEAAAGLVRAEGTHR